MIAETVGTVVGDRAEGRLFHAGTLTYTRFGLLSLFFWLLWGDFWFNLMEFLMPILLPITLKNTGASNLMIGIIVGSIPRTMTLLINPFVSTWSDRCRSRYGRRIPFIFLATPFVTIFLILVGYAQPIGNWLHAVAAGKAFAVSPTGVILIVISACAIGFQFFNMFIASIYNYLWADVVPEPVLGKFIGLFRVVGQGAGVFWNLYIFKYVDTHLAEIYAGIALLYFVSFMLMCWRVKEGEYPPPPPRDPHVGLGGEIKIYFRESFTVPLYLWLFAVCSVRILVDSADMFHIFFLRTNLHLSFPEIGRITFWCGLVAIPNIMFIGWLTDRLHPMRMFLIGSFASAVMSFAGYWIVQGSTSYLVYSITSSFCWLFIGVAQTPLYIMIFPKSRFGQFCSAMSMIVSLMAILGTPLAGVVFDLIKDYRYIYIWRGIFWTLSLIPLMFFYRSWLRHGGFKNYVPPAV